MTSEFDPDPETQERWMAALAALARTHLANLSAAPTNADLDYEPTPSDIPEAPLSGGVDAAMALIAEAARKGLNPTSPGYLAFVPGGGLFATAMADFVADILNRFTGLRETSPALVQMELDVLAWLAREFGYEHGGGAFTSGGSLANFAAVRAARHFKQADIVRGAGYRSSQAHGSVADAFSLAGFQCDQVRTVAVDSRCRMRVDDLQRCVAKDRAEGLAPFIVVANAGTVDTGAIDPLEDIAAFCAEEGLWLHVDAAYGGAFMLCDEGKRRLKGVALADSITFDPHKGMFLPYGTGCLLFKNPPQQGQHEAAPSGERYLGRFRTRIAPDPYRLELSRPYRGLRLWLPLMLYGARAFRDAVAEKLALAGVLYDGLLRLIDEGHPLEIADEPQLSITPFRLRRREGEPLEQWNDRTARLLACVNSGEVGARRSFFTGTYLDVEGEAVFTLRPCVLSHRTKQQQIKDFLFDLRSALDKIGR